MAHMNVSTKHKQTHRADLWFAGLVGSGKGMDYSSLGAGRCKLLQVEWIDKNVG